MLFGVEFDPSIYLMLKCNKHTSEKIKHVLSLMPEDFYQQVRRDYKDMIDNPTDRKELFIENSVSSSFSTNAGYKFDYELSDGFISIKIYCNEKEIYKFNLGQICSSDKRTFNNINIVGGFTELENASVNYIYEFCNSPVGCYLIESNENYERARKRIYPISYNKFLKVKTATSEEQKIEDLKNYNLLK